VNELILVKSEDFEDSKYDIFQGDEEYYMTREQIGTALGYANPNKAISNIHDRHKERLDQFSTRRVSRGDFSPVLL